MPEEKDDECELEMIDLGDAVEETKQVSPWGIQPDCYYSLGIKWGGC